MQTLCTIAFISIPNRHKRPVQSFLSRFGTLYFFCFLSACMGPAEEKMDLRHLHREEQSCSRLFNAFMEQTIAVAGDTLYRWLKGLNGDYEWLVIYVSSDHYCYLQSNSVSVPPDNSDGSIWNAGSRAGVW